MAESLIADSAPIRKGVVEKGTWAGADVKVSEILAAIDKLRRGGAQGGTRTSVLNLVIAARGPAEAFPVLAAINSLGGHHPARTLVLFTMPDAPSGIDADLSLHEASSGGVAVWFETIGLTVRGEAAYHLDSVIEPFTLPDLPVVVLYPGSVPGAGDPVLSAADVVVVDGKEAAIHGEFAALPALVRGRPVIDLSWVRLKPWRDLLIGLFDGTYRPFVAGVSSIEVSGKDGPRALLGGWLLSRLGLPREALTLVGSRHARVSLVAEAGGRRGEFVVGREDGSRLVTSSARIEGGPSHSDVIPLPERTLAWSLSEALSDLHRDRAYEQAVASAVLLGL